MGYVSVRQRRNLARKHQLACPRLLLYPLRTRVEVRNAASRYAQRRTRKCKGGLGRIRRAEKRLGIGKGARELRGMRVRLTIR